MKKKELNNLRGKTISELREMVLKKKDEAIKAGMRVLAGKEKNLKMKKNLSDEIAKILTLIREREIIEFLEKESGTKEKEKENKRDKKIS